MEPGGVRRGPRRKRHKKTFAQKLLEKAKRILKSSVKKAITDAVVSHVQKKVARRLKAGRAHVRSHHKGQYHVVNGSAQEGHVRRGPRRKESTSFKVRKRRAIWRVKAAEKRARGK